MPKKGSNIKLYIVIILMVALAVTTITFVYNYQKANNPQNVTIGLHVGDTFTYKLTGSDELYSSNADPNQEYPNFQELNNTNYYQVNITGISGPVVTFVTNWAFNNGTIIQQTGSVNVSSGAQTGQSGFWAIYPANLNVGSLTRPGGYDQITVNGTDTQTFSTSTRARNHFQVSDQFYDTNDPTQSTYRNEFDDVYFDKQTGMLTTLTDIQEYNNPEMTLIISWNLVSCSVWSV